MKRRNVPGQMLMDWNTAAAPPAKPTAINPPATDRLPNPELVQILPWDFLTTFPPVLAESIEAGTVAEEDALPKNLAAMHAEHANALRAALSDLDRVHEARRQGVNPATGKEPRSLKNKNELPAKLDQEVERLARWHQTLLDTYQEAFGPVAADAFDKCTRARHAGIEVKIDNVKRRVEIEPAPVKTVEVKSPEWPAHAAGELPVPRPLRRAVQAGVFGMDDAGPVDPSPEEVAEITEQHADTLTELIEIKNGGRSSDPRAEAQVKEAIQKYADDFGPRAARSLYAYCRRRTLQND